jgi:DNA-binding IclR family transcriptional regulator
VVTAQVAASSETDATLRADDSILGKAFAILGAFSQGPRMLSLSQISRLSGVPKSTTHRVLGMLVELGAVERSGTEYRMGDVMFSYGSRSPEVALRGAALPHLESLHCQTGQVVHFAVLRKQEVLYLERLSTSSIISPASVGDRLPAHLTGVGKALLAYASAETVNRYLDRRLTARTDASITSADLLRHELAGIRKLGVAFDHAEAARGLHCVAAPVRIGRQAVAAVSVAFPSSAGSGQVLIDPVLTAAARIASSLPRGDFELGSLWD